MEIVKNEKLESEIKKEPEQKEQKAIISPNIDFSKISILSPEVISKQATINIGTIGHVAHGKSTVVEALSGVKTFRFQDEKIRNITIHLGYANAKIFQCPNCKPPECYKSYPSHKEDNPPFERCKTPMNLFRHVSFVDCPGHDILMSTMLNGVAVMDCALLLVAANESCPQPQTSEHLAAVEMMNLKNIIILQNKIDIIMKDPSLAPKNYEEIKQFVKRTICEEAPIIPISAQLKINIDVICDYISKITLPIRDLTSAPRMIIIRSFDINKPGTEADKLEGGVVGGSIIKGILKIGDIVEIRPGLTTKSANNQTISTPIRSQVVSLQAEKNHLEFAVPGGLIGVGLKIDPALTRADKLVGNILGHPGQLPDIYQKIRVTYTLLQRLLGVKPSESSSLQRKEKVKHISKDEMLLVNIGSTSVG